MYLIDEFKSYQGCNFNYKSMENKIPIQFALGTVFPFYMLHYDKVV